MIVKQEEVVVLVLLSFLLLKLSSKYFWKGICWVESK